MTRLLAACVVLFSLIPNIADAEITYIDVVHLKDGTIVRGIIIEQIPDVSITVKTGANEESVYKFSEIEKLEREKVDLRGKKSPFLAWLGSFLFPGIGQYYNGDITKGLVQDGMFVVGTIIIFSESVSTNNNNRVVTGDEDIARFGAALVLGSWVWSMIDAPISAGKINRERTRLTYGHMIEFGNEKHLVGIDFGECAGSPGAKLTYHF